MDVRSRIDSGLGKQELVEVPRERAGREKTGISEGARSEQGGRMKRAGRDQEWRREGAWREKGESRSKERRSKRGRSHAPPSSPETVELEIGPLLV